MASPLASTDPAAPGTYAPPPEPSRRCPNCGTEARDAYCPHCGQEQTEVHRTLRAHADDLLDAFAGWDGKIPRTLWLLVRHPGLLTTEFLAGRRVRYVRPLKLYLWLSVLFFLAARIGADPGRGLNVNLSAGEARLPIRGDSLRAVGAVRSRRVDSAADAALREVDRARAARDSARASAPDSTDADALGRRFEQLVERRMEALKGVPAAERGRLFQESFLGNVGKMLFVLMPLFALLLRALYARGGWYYAEHLVFALHFHAFAMVAMTLVHFAPGAWSTAPLLWIPLWLWVALRRTYGGSRRRATLKWAALVGVYGFVLMLATSAAAVVAVLLLPT